MGRFEPFESGGTPTRIYLAGRVGKGSPGVLVLHPWWGLNADVTAYADRLGKEGFAVLAPDLYAGIVVSTVEEADRMSSELDQPATEELTLAAIDHLATLIGPKAGLATLGFSMGAAWALWSPAKRERIAGTVVYYGSLLGPSLARATAPVMGHFAGADPYETDEGVAAFEAALRSAGRRAQMYRYPGTGHWFAEPSRDAYVPAAADLAFDRTLSFLGKQLR